MQSKRIVIFFAALILLTGGLIILFKMNSKAEIETYSARITQDSEQITAEKDGIITYISSENNSPILEGHYIAEITDDDKKNCNNTKITTEEQKAADKYEDAAIKYKDGIISKDEYDKSLDEYRNVSKEISEATNCVEDNNSEKIYSTTNGILVYDGIKKGSAVKQGTLIATIKPKERKIRAYFSPKFSKQIENGMQAQITIIKYPEKQLTGTVESIEKTDINGISVIIRINEDVSALNINDNDNTIVRIVE